MIPILMPLADGHAIMPEVLQGIARQTMECVLIPVSFPEMGLKREGERLSRNLLLSIFKDNIKSNVALMMDRDIHLINSHTVERAINLLLMEHECGSVHICSKKNIDITHMDIGCMLIHKIIAQNIIFPQCHREQCLCGYFQKSLQDLKLSQQWLPSQNINELDAIAIRVEKI